MDNDNRALIYKLNIRKDFVKTLHRNKMGRGDCL